MALAGVAGLGAPAVLAQRRKVTIAYGQTPIEANDCIVSSLPAGAGLFAEEGLEVDVLAMAGGVAAVNMLASGQAQFTAHSGGGLFAGVDQDAPIQAFICQVPDNFFSLAITQDSPVHSAADLRGKTVGVPGLGGSTILSLKAVVQQAGLDPAADVEYLPVGGGFPAIDALRRDRVQALFLWDAPYARFEQQGAGLRYLKPDPLPDLGLSFITTASTDIIDRDPGLVAAMSRALAKAVVYMAAAPTEEIVKLHLKTYPANRSTTGSAADQLKSDLAIVQARIGYMHMRERVFSRAEPIGDETDARIVAMRDMLLKGGEIRTSHPAGRYFTRQFLAEMNRIDVPAVIERAKAFRA